MNPVPMPRRLLRLPSGLRLWLWGAFGSLFATGVVWLALHYSARPEEDFGSSTHPAEPWMLRIHGLAAFVSLMVLGAVYVRHVRPAWHAGRNRGSGLLLTGSLGLLILSGYGLYYFAGESLRAWTGYVHDFLGLALPVLIAMHILRGRSQRPKSGPSPRP